MRFFPNSNSLGSSAIVKVSGQNCFRTLYGSLGQICFGLPKGSAEGSTKVLCMVPPRFRWVCFTKVPHLSLKWQLFQKRFFLQGSANCSLHLTPSLVLGSKLHELLTCLTHTPPIRRKRPIMSLLLGYSLGLFFRISLGSRSPTTPTANLCPPQI